MIDGNGGCGVIYTVSFETWVEDDSGTFLNGNHFIGKRSDPTHHERMVKARLDEERRQRNKAQRRAKRLGRR